MEYLSESNLTMDLNKLKEINNRSNDDLQSVIMDLLNSPIFKTNKLKETENDIGIVYVLRNSDAHKIRDMPFIHQNFNIIVDRPFNVFFLAVEKSYMVQ
ncbi:MAG TPA: hypothetical protein VH500_13725 [Nitrososphaeraceae archaeon]|jgi:hypothetical protein